MSAVDNYRQAIQDKLRGFQPAPVAVAGPPSAPPAPLAAQEVFAPPQYAAPPMQGPPVGQPMQGPPVGQPMQQPMVAAGQPMVQPDGMPSTMIGSYLVAGVAGVLTLSLVVVLFARRR